MLCSTLPSTPAPSPKPTQATATTASAGLPLAADWCADGALNAATLRAVLRSHTLPPKTHTAAGWWGQTDFVLCRRHVDADGDAREDSVTLSVWKQWDFYIALQRQPLHTGLRGLWHRGLALVSPQPAPWREVFTVAWRRNTQGHDETAAWQAFELDEGALPQATDDAEPVAEARAACHEAWAQLLHYLRLLEGQHRARYPLQAQLHAALTPARLLALTEHPIFTEQYNDWWDESRRGFWDGDLWLGARQPCLHAGQPWGRLFKLSWRNGSEAPGDAADDAHACYQIDEEAARHGPALLHTSYAPRQSEPRVPLPFHAVAHQWQLLQWFEGSATKYSLIDSNTASKHADNKVI